MRKGENISKDTLLELKKCAHRVIIPLYIPNEEDYYKDAFTVFKTCLFSVRKTAISPLKVSVISNGSSASINKQLNTLLEEKHIDELIIETENIGKINSILKAVRTVDERLITITDADVLFLNNWEQEVINVFQAFPKAGVVCPVPVFRTHFSLTSNIWFNNFFSKRIKFLPVKNPEAMGKFARSIGWPRLDDKWKDVIGTIKAKNNTIAVLGSSHFVGTYKKEVFALLPKGNSQYKLGGDSEYLYTDEPILKMGGYRLSTYNNNAYHLGNTFEDWMQEIFNTLKDEKKTFNDFDDLKKLRKNRLGLFISEKIINKLIANRTIHKAILKMKGLTKNQISNFMS